MISQVLKTVVFTNGLNSLPARDPPARHAEGLGWSTGRSHRLHGYWCGLLVDLTARPDTGMRAAGSSGQAKGLW